MLKQVIENPIQFRTYFVESNNTGERVVCTLTRNVWNKVEGGAFFSYASQAVAISEADKCKSCNEWCNMSFDKWCENCVPF